jgi:hypothetical protein
MKNLDKRLDLSAKFVQMGQALMQEGDEVKDNGVALMGTILIFLGGIVLEDDDIFKFSELVGMFSAKKMLDNMEQHNSPIFEMIKGKAEEESYDDLIEKLKNLRKNNRKDEENEE